MRTCGRTIQAGGTQTGFQNAPRAEHQIDAGRTSSDKTVADPAKIREGYHGTAQSFWRKRKGCGVCAQTDPVRHVKPSAHHDDWLGCCRKTPGGLAVRCYKRPFLTRGHPFGVSDSEMSLGDMPRDATHQGTKCRRSSINLIIVGTAPFLVRIARRMGQRVVLCFHVQVRSILSSPEASSQSGGPQICRRRLGLVES
jgi:hypothetical protein